MNDRDIEIAIKELPDSLKQEVYDFIELLKAKQNSEVDGDGFDFAWEGGLSDLKDEFSSVELQHKSTEWR